MIGQTYCGCGLSTAREPSISLRYDGFYRCNDCEQKQCGPDFTPITITYLRAMSPDFHTTSHARGRICPVCSKHARYCGHTHADMMAFLQRPKELAPLAELQKRAVLKAYPDGSRAGGFIDQGASRKNSGKPPMHLLPWDALAMVSWVLHFGATKYAARNWENGGLSWTDCVRAITAHVGKLLCGEWLDDESGCPHVAHIACNALFLCAMSARGIGVRDLPMHPLGGDVTQHVWKQTSEQKAACEALRTSGTPTP